MSSDPTSPSRRRASSVGLLLALALVVAGAWLTLSERGVVGGAVPGSVEDAVVASVAGDGGEGGVVSAGTSPPEPVAAAYRPGSPRTIDIPALTLHTTVLPVGAPGRVLVPPSDPAMLGWWADGAEPGAARGSVLIAGHSTGSGDGALDDLETLQRDDRVVVETRHGEVVYDVRTVRIFDKGLVARRAAELFDQRSKGRLVLLTCEDWDGSRYLSNVVVTAVPAR